MHPEVKMTEEKRQQLIAMSRRAMLGTGMGLGGIAMAEILGTGAARAAGAGAAPAGDAGPDMGKLATGQFPARRVRQHRLRLILIAHHQQIRKIRRGGLDLNDQLTRAGKRVVDLLDLQLFGLTPGRADDGFHARAPGPMASF